MSVLNYRTAKFMQSAAKLHQCPNDIGVEVAFAGRSNAGKSSAINAITDNAKLARTSKTPGRTQLLNFFQVTERQRLVDLPGYGFAKVPLHMKQAWQRDMEEYLRNRMSLVGLVLVMDVRHPLQEFDLMMLEWAAASNMRTHILLTKADKLKRGPAQSSLLKVKKSLAEYPNEVSVQLFSALKRTGVDQVHRCLNEWLQEPEELEEEAEEWPEES